MNLKTLVLASAVCLLFNAEACAQVYTSVGDAVELKTGKPAYREFHTFSKAPDDEYMRTAYKTIDGQVIATRNVEFRHGFAQRYTFKQTKPHIEKTVVRSAQSIDYTAIDGEKKTQESFSADDIQRVIVNAGMFNAVEREWTRLLQGETVKIDLVVPERGRTFTMNLKQADIAKSALAKHQDTEGKVLFKLTIANRFFRLLLKPIELGYDRQTQRLIFYQGPSNIRHENGDKIGDIRINYTNK